MTSTMELPRGIRLRGGKFFVDVTHDGKRRTATRNSLDEAMVARAELRAAMERGEEDAPISDGSAWTLETAWKRTLRERWEGRASERNVIIHYNRIERFFGRGEKLDRITTERLDAFADQMADEGASGATINRHLATISRILRTAHQRRKLAGMPHIPRRQETTARHGQLTREEEAELLASARHFGYDFAANAWIVLVDTGMRAGELFKLETADVDFERNELLIRVTKNGQPRVVPMTKRTAEVITDVIVHRQTYQSLRWQWDVVRKHMGKEDDPTWVMHSLRHTCASRLVQAGVPLQVVKEWLGHKTIQVTLRYAYLAPQNLHAAVSALEQ